MKYSDLANDIIRLVGGKENINSVIHCVTRLRFYLKDESKADTAALEAHDNIVTVRKSAGQYQVVIGNHVKDVYDAVVEEAGLGVKRNTMGDEQEDKKGFFSNFLEMLSSIFLPILPYLMATGIIKGFNAMFVAFGWLSNESGTYLLLNAVGDGFFTFLPIFLGYTAMKKFGGTPFLGMAIAAALVHPSLVTIAAGKPYMTLFEGSIIESPINISFLGIPVILMSYTSSVIPIIVSTYFGAKLEKYFVKVIPDVVKSFIVPFFTLLIIVPLTFIIIGPIATWIAKAIGAGIQAGYELSPLVAGLLVGGLWQVLVIFGVHWGLLPIYYNNLSVQGSDILIAMTFAASFAQCGAVLAVWLKSKNEKLKSLSIPAFISALFGVTEPAIYGITLPLKTPFVMSCIASSIGGAIIALTNARLYSAGPLGIFKIPTYINPETGIDVGFYGMLVAILVATILGFILTYFFGNVNKNEKESVLVQASDSMENKVDVSPVATENDAYTVDEVTVTEELNSPLNGRLISLSEVPDEVFASGAIGKGAAIIPYENKVFAPANGVVTTLFPSKHAIGLTTHNQVEVLIHVGMDTVQLEGKHFTAHVSQNQEVRKGDLLLEFDKKTIEKVGYSTITPVVITNSDMMKEVMLSDKGNITIHDVLAVIEK